MVKYYWCLLLAGVAVYEFIVGGLYIPSIISSNLNVLIIALIVIAYLASIVGIVILFYRDLTKGEK